MGYLEDLSDREMLARIFFQMKAGRTSGSQHYWQIAQEARAAATGRVERLKGCTGVSGKNARVPWAALDDALAKRWALCHACMIRRPTSPTAWDRPTPPFLDRECMGKAREGRDQCQTPDMRPASLVSPGSRPCRRADRRLTGRRALSEVLQPIQALGFVGKRDPREARRSLKKVAAVINTRMRGFVDRRGIATQH